MTSSVNASLYVCKSVGIVCGFFVIFLPPSAILFYTRAHELSAADGKNQLYTAILSFGVCALSCSAVANNGHLVYVSFFRSREMRVPDPSDSPSRGMFGTLISSVIP